jgi:glycosyltransferase involved in cell wall biosynthesis
VHVSKTVADLYNDRDYVWIGLDPDDFIFSNQKEEYFLYMADMSKYMEKGLDIALELARKQNLNLKVAGSSRLQSDIDIVQTMCDECKADYVGDVRGEKRAKLLAGAKALISPSRLPEASGTALAEALFSGTPVICSNTGAYGEIISKNVGFVCNNENEYYEAIEKVENTIDPEVCRQYAMDNFHYKKTTEQYIPIYEQMLLVKTK